MRKIWFAALALFLGASTGQAALVLHVPDVVLSQSASIQTGSFLVYLEETDSTQANVSSYNVGLLQSASSPITITRSIAVAPHPSLFNKSPAMPSPQPAGYTPTRDIYLADEFLDENSAPINAAVVNGTADGLFRINYTIPENTVGTFPFNVDTNPLLFQFAEIQGANVVPIAGIVVDNGSITINPVPEPATLGLALLGLPLVLRRRR
jgi:hypothetical protein